MLRSGFIELVTHRRLVLVMALVIAFPVLTYLLLDAYRNGIVVSFTASNPSLLVVQSNGSMGEFYGSRLPAQLEADLAARGAGLIVPEIHSVVGGTPATAVLLRGIPLDTYEQVEEFRMVAGRPLSPADGKSPGAQGGRATRLAMLGDKLAEKRGLTPGDTIEIRGRAFQVVGVFSTGTYVDHEAWISLPDAQALLGWGSDVSVFIIPTGTGLKPGDSLVYGSSVVPKGDSGADFIQEWSPFLSLLGNVVIALSLGAVIALANMLSRLAWQRRRELAIFRSLGFGRGAMGLYLWSQGITITLLGFVLGTAGALMLGMLFEADTAGFTLHALFNVKILFSSLVFALVLALAGSAFPVWQMSRFNLVSLLRDD
jgi:ABC-type lipoprotein release transport system permease subunit